jgi:glyoxylase-like metal-dependent hydrolase (beta-lactamase superfamily II)
MEERHFGPVWFIPGKNNGKYPYCHSVYIEGAGILIDPASDRRRLEELRDRHGVQAVWLSHWHEDHFMHLDLFEQVPVWISREDAPPLSDLDILMDWYGVENNAMRRYWRQLMLDQFNFRPRQPQGYLQGGEQIRLDGLTVDVIAAPGHTPGHLAFHFREPDVLFLGDYDLTRFGPWYGDVHSSIEQTIESIDRLKRISARVLLTSHETGVFEEPADDLWERYKRVIDEREGKIVQAMDRPKSLEEIVNLYLIYGRAREPRDFYEFCERALVRKHIERLEQRGNVLREHRCCVDPFDDMAFYLLAHTCGGGEKSA